MKRIGRSVWVLVVGMVLSGPTHAQEVPLTLERALSLAREHNPALARAAAAERGAEGASAAARGHRGPAMGLDVLHLRFQDPPSLALPPTGTFAPIPASGTVVQFGVRQPVYTGGRTRSAVHAAEWSGRAAGAAREGAEVELTAEVARAFDAALLADALSGVAEERVRVLRAALAVSVDQYEEGVVARLDVLRAETRLASAEQERRAAIEVVRATREGLAVVVGLDPATAAPVAGALVSANLTLDSTAAQDLLARARADRPELRALRARSQAARRRADMARAERRPSAGLYVGGLATRPELVTGQEGWTADLVVGLVVTWPFLDWGRSAGEAEVALAESEALQAEARNAADAATVAVLTHVRNLERAVLDMAAGRENVARTERALEIAQRRYEDGIGIQLEVFEAEADLSSAWAALLGAIHDHRAAAIELHRAAGLPVDAALLTPGGSP